MKLVGVFLRVLLRTHAYSSRRKPAYDISRWSLSIQPEIVEGMATIDLVTKFGREAVQVERLLQKVGVTTRTGRTILVLAMASAEKGVQQKKIVEVLAMSKESVTKLLQPMIDAELLTKERAASDARSWQILTTVSGRELVSEVKSVLRSRRESSRRSDEPPW
jgi:DNA-binding MarR family transcriptional regulator